MFSEPALIVHVIDFNLVPNGTFTFQTGFCWGASPCVVCDGYQRVEGTCQAHLQGAFLLKMGQQVLPKRQRFSRLYGVTLQEAAMTISYITVFTFVK